MLGKALYFKLSCPLRCVVGSLDHLFHALSAEGDQSAMAASNFTQTVAGVPIKAPVPLEFAAIFTPEAQTFLATLHREFNDAPRSSF